MSNQRNTYNFRSFAGENKSNCPELIGLSEVNETQSIDVPQIEIFIASAREDERVKTTANSPKTPPDHQLSHRPSHDQDKIKELCGSQRAHVH